MRASIVGTTKAWVTASSRARVSQPSAVKLGNGTIRRPAYGELSTAATPATWNGGTARSTASSASADANSTVLEMDDSRGPGGSTPALGAAEGPPAERRIRG